MQPPHFCLPSTPHCPEALLALSCWWDWERESDWLSRKAAFLHCFFCICQWCQTARPRRLLLSGAGTVGGAHVAVVHSPPMCAKSKHCSVQSTSCEMPPPPHRSPALCSCPPSKPLWEGLPRQAAHGSGSVSGYGLEAAQGPRCQLLAPTQPSTALGKVPPLPT